jgi:hypothetical protein
VSARDESVESRERSPSSHRELRAASRAERVLKGGLAAVSRDPALEGYVGFSSDPSSNDAFDGQRNTEAMRALEVALDLDPTDITAKSLLATAHFREGSFAAAAALFEELVIDDPERPTHKLNLALSLLRSGEVDLVRPVFDDLSLRWPHLVASAGLDTAFEEAEGAASMRAHTQTPPAQSNNRAVTAVPPGAVPEPFNVPVELSSPRMFRASVPPSFVASVSRRDGLYPSPIAPASHTIQPPPVFAEAPSVPPSHAHASTLLEAALSSLVVVPASGAATAHPTGLIFVPLVDAVNADPEICGFSARAMQVHALAGDVYTRMFSVPEDDDKPFLRAHAETFVHAVGRGHVVLAPQEGRYLVAVRMGGDVTFVREDYLSGYERRLSCAIGSFRLAGKRSMSMVRLIGEGILVLDLPRRFISYDVTEAASLTVRDDTLLGWVGRIVTEPLDGAIPSRAGGGLLRLAGEGTVLVIPPKRNGAGNGDNG